MYSNRSTFVLERNKVKGGSNAGVSIYLQTDLTVGNESTRTWEFQYGEVITLDSKVVEADFINQFTISHHRYEKWKNGQLMQTELERFPLRWYGIEEFKMIIEQIGFEEIMISADYKYGNYPTHSTQTITFEAIANK